MDSPSETRSSSSAAPLSPSSPSAARRRAYLETFSASGHLVDRTSSIHAALQAASPLLPQLASSPSRLPAPSHGGSTLRSSAEAASPDPLARSQRVLDSSAQLVARLAELEAERREQAAALTAETAAHAVERARSAQLAVELGQALQEARSWREEAARAAGRLSTLTEVVSGLLARSTSGGAGSSGVEDAALLSASRQGGVWGLPAPGTADALEGLARMVLRQEEHAREMPLSPGRR